MNGAMGSRKPVLCTPADETNWRQPLRFGSCRQMRRRNGASLLLFVGRLDASRLFRTRLISEVRVFHSSIAIPRASP
jgi:hypothetical protein